jgi:hypothetical protein
MLRSFGSDKRDAALVVCVTAAEGLEIPVAADAAERYYSCELRHQGLKLFPARKV